MSFQTTRGRHRSPLRGLFGRLGAPSADARPSLELPAGHMRQRPYDQVVLGDARRYRKNDVIEITSHTYAPHNGRVGVVLELSGTFRPLVVEIPGVGVIHCAESEVDLLEAAPDADTLVMDALVAAVSPAEAPDAELAQYYADIAAEDAAQPSTSMQDNLEYAAACAAAGNPLMPFEREIMGLPLDDDDVVLMGGAAR